MKLNFYQVAVIIFLVGLFGYFVWPTLYSYEDIKVVTSPAEFKSFTDRLISETTETTENVRNRTHRINGTADRDMGLGRWTPYVRPRKCGEPAPFEAKPSQCERMSQRKFWEK